ncbi:permease [Mailhella sp.]|uniref:permease n=1 Tax=Mailhella sp. TaxID=1981029 RepID=UPI004062F4E6
MDNERFLRLLKGAAALGLWLAAYNTTLPFSRWLTYSLFGFEQGSGIGNAVQFFLYDTPKILLLLVFMIYVIGWLRAGLNTDRVREYLKGKGRGAGYVLGAVFGAVTPFCSCSSIPLFIGFLTARIPLGITMSFLITSPIINEVAIVLLWSLLGWKLALAYIAVGLLAGILGGLFMDALRGERWLQPYLLEQMKRPALQMLMTSSGRLRLTADDRHRFALHEVRTIFSRVWKWVMLGVLLGAALHGFVPEAWFAEHLSQGQWWNVPAAVALGIPLYTNVTGIVPVMESLLMKGLPVGTTLAFCMSSVAASLPELIMLKQVMRTRLLALFLLFLWLVFTLTGWLLNALPFLLS